MTDDNHPRFQFRDRFTGQPPTLAEWREMQSRAREILDNWKYSAPEQLDWALLVEPDYAEQVIVWAP